MSVKESTERTSIGQYNLSKLEKFQLRKGAFGQRSIWASKTRNAQTYRREGTNFKNNLLFR
jgi:hypothetical protein